ncbi:MAG: hypothetical protein U9Q71_07145 [Pseudomonadota bacterium]|nr:hypothetical protein [Pseudomonadota bacterium]
MRNSWLEIAVTVSFFSWSSLRCEFCQNWEISQKGREWETVAEDLAKMMLILRPKGFHNNYFVTPSHVVTRILKAVLLAARRGDRHHIRRT